jgi:hypothetical protein
VTTSPNDPQYLADTADAVRQLNKRGSKSGNPVSPLPVDFLTAMMLYWLKMPISYRSGSQMEKNGRLLEYGFAYSRRSRPAG